MKETKIIYQDVSPDAKVSASYTATHYENYSDFQPKLNNPANAMTDFATFENNYWHLNGSIPLFPNSSNRSNYTWGLVSNTISDANGNFASGEEPTLTINYTTWQSSVGITLDFNTIRNEYPTSVTIAYYQNNTLLDQTTYSCNAKQYGFIKRVEDYNKVIITFHTTNVPYRRIRVINIYYGIIREFGENEIVSVSALEEIDPMSTNLSINTMNFSIKSEPEIPYLFQAMQPLQLIYDGNLIGSYFVKQGIRKTLTDYDISCEDSIGALDKMQYMGGIFNNKNAKELIDEIMTDTLLNYQVDPALNSDYVSGYIPICKKREALLYVAFATGSVVDTSRSSNVNFYKLDSTILKTFTDDNTFNKGNVTTQNIVTSVSLSAYSYTLKSTAEEIFKQTLPVGDHLLTFDKPHANYSISGGSLLQSLTNAVKIRVSSAGTVTITAKEYEESSVVYTKENPRTKLTDSKNEVSSTSCKLVNTGNAQSLLELLYTYVMLRESISASVILDDGESNAPSVGNFVRLPSVYNETVIACLKRINLKFSATKLVGEVEGVIISDSLYNG